MKEDNSESIAYELKLGDDGNMTKEMRMVPVTESGKPFLHIEFLIRHEDSKRIIQSNPDLEIVLSPEGETYLDAAWLADAIPDFRKLVQFVQLAVETHVEKEKQAEMN